MKSLRLVILAIVAILVWPDAVGARAVRIWSYQELLENSDLAVIAIPAATKDTSEHIDLPGFGGQQVIGVETKFAASVVLKGDKTLKDFVLHYYRPILGGMIVPNGPTFVYFAISYKPAELQRAYLLFLHREADGRYAPVVGQVDPGLGVRQLEGVYENAVSGTQTRLGIDIANILKECHTIKPGMIRSELSKIFDTEGGLSSAAHRTYVCRDCPYVKVDVDFTLSVPSQVVETPTDTVTKISKPYLDWSIGD